MSEKLTTDGYRLAIRLHRETGAQMPLTDAVIGACSRIARAERALHLYMEADCNGWVPNWYDKRTLGEPTHEQRDRWQADFVAHRDRAVKRVEKWLTELEQRALYGGYPDDVGPIVNSWATGGDPRSGSGLRLNVHQHGAEVIV